MARTTASKAGKGKAGVKSAKAEPKVALGKKRPGRPTSFQPEMGDRICAQIVEGKSLRSIEAMPGFPMVGSIMRWLTMEGPLFDVFREQYARAREARADARFERIDEVIQDMRDGEIDAQQARVQIDAMKWQMGRENGKRYGESMTLKGDKDNPLQVARAIDLSDDALLAVAAGDRVKDDG